MTTGLSYTPDFDRQSAERSLWAAVVIRQLLDMCSLNAIERMAAERWVDSGEPFRRVCDLAGMDPGATHARLARVRGLPLRERRRRYSDRFYRYGRGGTE
jgi:hypothetical protein